LCPSPELSARREIVRGCLAPTHAARAARVPDTGALLRRLEEAGIAALAAGVRAPRGGGTSPSARLPRLRPRRWRRPVLVAVLAATAVLGGTAVTYALRDDPPAATEPPSCEKPAVDEEHGVG
jgi:hypothetical protein